MSRRLQTLFSTFVFLVITVMSASAQPATSLTGTYRCVKDCASGFEISPTTQIWIEALQQVAVYSPDGLTIQFDRGTVWLRAQQVVPYATEIAYCARRFRSYDAASQTYLGRDGRRYPCP